MKSPLRVRCKPWPFPKKAGERRRQLCKWVCVAPPRGAEFKHRKLPMTAILHPSTKRAGMYQLSIFDEHGAVSDVVRTDCSIALYDAEILPLNWKLVAVG